MEYPKHCESCHKLKICEQKQYMMANTEPVPGYVNFDLGDYVCETHRTDEYKDERLHNPESDMPLHCSICGRPLECELTQNGIDYVLENTHGGCCQELWLTLFADYWS